MCPPFSGTLYVSLTPPYVVFGKVKKRVESNIIMRRFSLNRLGLGGITGNKPHKPKYKNVNKKKPVKDF